MMWDDHELLNDYDGGPAGPRYAAARAAADVFEFSHGPGPLRAGEVYYAFQAADVDFFVLDTRSHRSPNATPDGPAKTLLGAQQKADLKAWLSASRAPFKIVASSVPLHDLNGSRDAWGAFAAERAEILDYVRQQGIGGVVFLTGDQHWSSLIQHEPAAVWEFNATPLGSSVRPPSLGPETAPRVALAYGESTAFGIVDVDTRAQPPRLTFRVVDDQGRTRAERTVAADN
jgi:alkaline phosphatase D